MRNRNPVARNDVRRWLTLAALLAATTMPVTAFGGDRVVLGDEFTATW
jgi:hypothetical protein